jgi:hypothetical protein
MLRTEDLDAAVKAGVITPEQRAALAKQAGTPDATQVPHPAAGDPDERFQFSRGFNDVFLAIGVALITGAFLTQWSPSQGSGIGFLLAGAAVLWAISELVVGRHKAVLPGIVAVTGIGLLVSLAAGHLAFNYFYDGKSFRGGLSNSWWWNYPFGVWFSATGAGGLAVLAYYLRFRLPFAWLPMGYCLAQAVVTLLSYQLGFEGALPFLNATSLILGAVLFVLAMQFDGSDPHRVTRRSDCGFWLHMAAAPFIVGPVISMVGGATSTGAAIVIIAMVLVLGLVALIVDRRALLVSSLLYFGFAVTYLITQTASVAGFQNSLMLTLGILGAFVLLLGLGWHPLRRLLLAPFSGAGWLKYLPPVQA